MRLVAAPPRGDRVPYPLVFGALTLLCAAGAWLRVSFTSGWIPSLCLFRRLTGIPCPACHATRALASLLTGSVGASLAWNPLAALLALASVAAALASLARRLSGRPALALRIGPREGVALRAAAAVILAANWIFLIVSR
jgi:hypothetical protein